jgi:hypothetical protein
MKNNTENLSIIEFIFKVLKDSTDAGAVSFKRFFGLACLAFFLFLLFSINYPFIESLVESSDIISYSALIIVFSLMLPIYYISYSLIYRLLSKDNVEMVFYIFPKLTKQDFRFFRISLVGSFIILSLCSILLFIPFYSRFIDSIVNKWIGGTEEFIDVYFLVLFLVIINLFILNLKNIITAPIQTIQGTYQVIKMLFQFSPILIKSIILGIAIILLSYIGLFFELLSYVMANNIIEIVYFIIAAPIIIVIYKTFLVICLVSPLIHQENDNKSIFYIINKAINLLYGNIIYVAVFFVAISIFNTVFDEQIPSLNMEASLSANYIIIACANFLCFYVFFVLHTNSFHYIMKTLDDSKN